MSKIYTGKTQTLTVLRNTEIGVYLGENASDDGILLPKKQVPEGAKIGDQIDVFVYRDSEDRLIATVRKPAAEVGGFGWFRVKGVTKVGAFLDWGLEKDLFLPYKEQETAFKAGDTVCVYLYLDKADRICATTKLYDHLIPALDGDFKAEDRFTGYVYRTQKEFGAFVAVTKNGAFDQLYFGLIPASQVFQNYRIGEKVTGRIVRVRPDGKLDLSVRARAFEQLDADGELILKKIDEYDGELPFSESASPEIIKRELQMSKNGFKKALGHLLKAGKIEILEKTVKRV